MHTISIFHIFLPDSEFCSSRDVTLSYYVTSQKYSISQTDSWKSASICAKPCPHPFLFSSSPDWIYSRWNLKFSASHHPTWIPGRQILGQPPQIRLKRLLLRNRLRRRTCILDQRLEYFPIGRCPSRSGSFSRFENKHFIQGGHILCSLFVKLQFLQ